MIYVIQKIHHFRLISRGCARLSMKRGGCKFGGSKTGAVLCPKRGAVVSQLVLKLKESVPPPPPPRAAAGRWDWAGGVGCEYLTGAGWAI